MQMKTTPACVVVAYFGLRPSRPCEAPTANRRGEAKQRLHTAQSAGKQKSQNKNNSGYAKIVAVPYLL